ncbi:hypothetical protein [Agromyces seonyuensis]|uniref:Uncharacterized protein n=1 Tax=Agromyces seonyuensis TaxID=2662446 RepID=A0A6I4NZX7_9MICO|nr:hypothetical protein [Agromyces seonyuensis]MWB97309.1 hypothetical protein [Agromyces seonyuensis]
MSAVDLPLDDGLDLQQRAMGSAGQIQAALSLPATDDPIAAAMGSASQSVLARLEGAYVTSAAVSAVRGAYAGGDVEVDAVVGSYVSAAAAATAAAAPGRYVDAQA